MTNDLPTLGAAWESASLRLEAAKAEEAVLRKQVIEAAFNRLEVGTNKRELVPGIVLSAVLKQTIAAERDSDKTYTSFIHHMSYLPGDVREELVTWKPEISMSAYKRLTDDQRKIVDHVVVIKDATPSLSVSRKA
jgi:hypothetical protein